jgi:hypothetical protein
MITETIEPNDKEQAALRSSALLGHLDAALAEWRKDLAETEAKVKVLNDAADLLAPDKKLDIDIMPLIMKCITYQRCLMAVEHAKFMAQHGKWPNAVREPSRTHDTQQPET